MTTTPTPLPADLEAPSTGRLQLALNVDDLDAAIDFYTRMFGVGPVKVKPGYANFAVARRPSSSCSSAARGSRARSTTSVWRSRPRTR